MSDQTDAPVTASQGEEGTIKLLMAHGAVIRRRMDANSAGTGTAGEWNDCLPGYITSVELSPRWEYHVENFFGIVRLACIELLLKRL